MSSPSAPYQGMSDLALPLCGPCREIGGPGMNPPVADLMYLSSETAGDLDLESKKCKGLNVNVFGEELKMIDDFWVWIYQKLYVGPKILITLHFLQGSLTSC